MNELEKKSLFEAYNERTHLFGRIACIITLVLLIVAALLAMGYGTAIVVSNIRNLFP